MYSYFQTICVGLFFGMVFSQVIAYQFAKRRGKELLGMAGTTVETAIFALMGLIIAFTFGTAQGRYEYRRQQIVEELNASQTVNYRLKLLPEEFRKDANELFREFLNKRIDYSYINTSVAAENNIRETLKIQNKLWDLVVKATSSKSEASMRRLVLPPLNDLFGVVNKRLMAAYTHTSTWIIFMFAVIAMICSILSGFRMAKREMFTWSYVFIFSFTIAMTMYVILDFEYPRYGFIGLQKFESVLLEREQDIIQQMTNTSN